MDEWNVLRMKRAGRIMFGIIVSRNYANTKRVWLYAFLLLHRTVLKIHATPGARRSISSSPNRQAVTTAFKPKDGSHCSCSSESFRNRRNRSALCLAAKCQNQPPGTFNKTHCFEGGQMTITSYGQGLFLSAKFGRRFWRADF